MGISLDDIKRNAQTRMSGVINPPSISKLKKQLDQPLDTHRIVLDQPTISKKPVQKSPKSSNKNLLQKQKKEDEQKMNIRKKHPNNLSKEAMNVINDNNHLILGSLGCGHCRNEHKIIDGKYRALSVIQNKGKVELGYTWENYKESIKSSLNASKQIEQLFKDKKISSQQYKELKSNTDHIIMINKALLDPSINYDNIRKNYRIFYVDDIDPKQMKLAQKIIHQVIKEKLSLDDIYKQLKTIPDGEKIKNYIIGQEIMQSYSVQAFPTFINDNCEVKKNANGKMTLEHCKQSGFIEGYGLLEYDAEQRKDTKLLQTIQEVKKKYDKTTPDIQDLLSQIKR